VIGAIAATTACLVDPASADTESAAAGGCQIGKGIEETSQLYLDANGNGVWDGQAGGDRRVALDAFRGPGALFVGDWNGDGWHDAGKLVGSVFSLDLNGNGVWEGNAGGDRARSFATLWPGGVPLVGDWNADGRDAIGRRPAGAKAEFLLDLDGDGVWSGMPIDANAAPNIGSLATDAIAVMGD
jgi:hypothetical protein